MLIFQLPYSLLYTDNLPQLVTLDLDLELDQLSESNAQILNNRLEDSNYTVKLAYSHALLLGIESLDVNTVDIRLLAAELNLYGSISNCFVRNRALSYILASPTGVTKKTGTLAVDEYPPQAARILAHGLRWGWTIVEQIGQYFILSAELDTKTGQTQNYRLDSSGCSCQAKNCVHATYIKEVVKRRQDLNFCINQLTNPTLL